MIEIAGKQVKMAKINKVLINHISQEAIEWIQSYSGSTSKEELWAELGVSHKKDKSVVTELDLKLSKMTFDILKESGLLEENAFFCEELSDRPELSFPTFILDPVDGTRELVRGMDEWCYSLAYMASMKISDKSNLGWIYAPQIGLSVQDEALVWRDSHLPQAEKPWLGLVSRSEWEKGFYEALDVEDYINISPRGSIALKLAMLAIGSCDFVVSRNPKNIWDIAAGTILCSRRNIKLYNLEGEVELLDQQLIDGPLLWCRENYYSELKSILKNLE